MLFVFIDEFYNRRFGFGKVIGVLTECGQNVVLLRGLDRVVHDDVICLPNYANAVLANGAAIVPQYGRPADATALRVLSNAGYRTFGVAANTIAESNYVFHCMSKAVPKHRGAVASRTHR